MIENFILLIASELQNNSYIRIKNIGKFSVEQRGGADEWIQNSFGQMQKRYVEPFIVQELPMEKALCSALVNSL